MAHESGTRVLLIEDGEADTFLVRELLGEEMDFKFTLDAARKLAEGIEELDSGSFDIVLLDLSLPDSQGLDTFVQLYERFPNVPIVILTGLDDESLAASAVSKGAQDYLVKGELSGQLLQRAIRYAIERRRAEEESRRRQEHLVQADKMIALGVLVSGVAHEINNPNSFVMSNVSAVRKAWQDMEIILEKYYVENGDFILGGVTYSENRGRIGELLSGILEGSVRIKAIVRELNDFSRQEASSLDMRLDVNEVLESALTLTANMIKKHAKHFRQDFANDLPIMLGNPQRIEQVVINLIQNACQALEDGDGALHITTHFDRPRNCVVITVRDEGCGIPEEILNRVCDPFFTTKRDIGGVGLGLAISTLIVDQHGGTMEFDTAPGEGTTVKIELPIVSGDSSPGAVG